MLLNSLGMQCAFELFRKQTSLISNAASIKSWCLLFSSQSFLPALEQCLGFCWDSMNFFFFFFFGMIYLRACLFDKTMLVDELLHVGSSCIGSLLQLYTVEEWWLKEFSRINKLMYIDSINGILSITTDNHFFFSFLVTVKHLQWKYIGSCTCTMGVSKQICWTHYAVIKIHLCFIENL